MSSLTDSISVRENRHLDRASFRVWDSNGNGLISKARSLAPRFLKFMLSTPTQFARVWIGGRSGMVGGTNLDPSRETNLDLLHVAASCHMLCMLHHVALSCRRRLRRYHLLKGRDCLFIRFVIQYLPTNIGMAFHDPF